MGRSSCLYSHALFGKCSKHDVSAKVVTMYCTEDGWKISSYQLYIRKFCVPSATSS